MRFFLIVFLLIPWTVHAQTYPYAFTKISKTQGNLSAVLDVGAQFGIMSTAIGDLDDDGVTDVAVGATNQGGFAVGSVYILFLNASGTVKNRAVITNFETGNPDSFGSSVCALGDLDGDGVEDIGIGANYDEDGGTQWGAFWIVFLNTNGTVKGKQKISVISGNLNDTLNDMAEFGTGATNLGDIDHDGVTDLAVGAFHYGSSMWGGVFILFMNSNGTVKSHTKITHGTAGLSLDANGNFGYALSKVGDLDGDGTPELAVGGHRNGSAGATWILFLTSAGTVKKFTKISPGVPNFTEPTGSIFGVALTAINDYDGDGVPDLVVGGNDASLTGAIWYIMLKADGTVKATYKISGNTANTNLVLHSGDFFGGSLGTLGDLNSDGVVEIMVGAFQDDDGGVNTGAVWISSSCKPPANAGVDISLCVGNPVTMNATPPTFGTGTWSVLQGNGNFSDTHDAKAVVTQLAVGTNLFMWTVFVPACGSNKDTVRVTITKPTTNAGSDITTCVTSPVTMSAAPPTTGSGAWTTLQGMGTISNTQDPKAVITNLGTGANAFVWTISIPGCGLAKDTVKVIANPIPIATIDMADSVLTCTKSYEIKALKPVNGTGLWTVVSGDASIAAPASPSTQVNLKGQTTKLAWNVSTQGCAPAADYLTVAPFTFTEKKLPNVITPNGDGKNDFWKIEHIQLVPNTIRMYDRWGLPVFEVSDYKNNWSGGNLSAGAYYYYLLVPSCNITVKGVLNIMD